MVTGLLQLTVLDSLRPRLCVLSIVDICPEDLHLVALHLVLAIARRVLDLILDLRGAEKLLEVRYPLGMLLGELPLLLAGLPATLPRRAGQVAALAAGEAVLDLLLLDLQHGGDVGDAGGLLVHEDAGPLLLGQHPPDLVLVFLVELLRLNRVARPLPRQPLLRDRDHLAGRRELALHRELAEEVVGAEADLGVAEVDGVEGHPHVFAEGRGNGLLAVEDELAEDIVFLYPDRLSQ